MLAYSRMGSNRIRGARHGCSRPRLSHSRIRDPSSSDLMRPAAYLRMRHGKPFHFENRPGVLRVPPTVAFSRLSGRQDARHAPQLAATTICEAGSVDSAGRRLAGEGRGFPPDQDESRARWTRSAAVLAPTVGPRGDAGADNRCIDCGRHGATRLKAEPCFPIGARGAITEETSPEQCLTRFCLSKTFPEQCLLPQ